MSTHTSAALLPAIHYPHQLRQLDEVQLPAFCQELRDYIIEHVSVHGGHFAASLGVVEITTALHYVYNTPHDRIVWDVGHQAYGHKLITGRRDRFHTNRIYGGVSGFPKRSESEYDTFGVGHSSTSISAALGMALAARHQGIQRHAVAVIGDGALTGGMAFEALNHAGASGADMLVILNDNCMSIDPNVGALKEYLTDISTSRTYNRLRDEAWKWLGGLDKMGIPARQFASKLEDTLLSSAKPGMLFEALGFRYFGPVDGHDVNHLVRLLRDLNEIKGPKLLHCVTVKGKGFAPAEADQTKWHAPSFNFDKITGTALAKPAPSAPQPPKYQDVFGHTLIELAQADSRIMGVTPAMLSGSGMIPFQKALPDRCFDVGIAEQHAVTVSAGMATEGLVPFCNIYSTFMQRGFDQVVHDVAIQDLKVVFCLDRAGLVGADGATHHGAYDIAYMRCLPNMIVAAPMDEQELRNLMYTAKQDDQTHPFVIRYPRGNGVMPEWRTPLEVLPIGKGRCITPGEEVAILTIGHMGNLARQAVETLQAQGLRPAHYDMRYVKPLDADMLHEIAANFRYVVTVEDGCVQGGFGSAVLEWLADNAYTHLQVRRLGIPDRPVHHGTQEELWAECGYDAAAMVAAVCELVQAKAVSV
jgi:1-deoxy-D-xylulose-5-phosphate synthase